MIRYVNCRPSNTPTVKGAKFSLDICPKTPAKKKAHIARASYTSVVRNMMYTMACTRRDIS